MKLPLSLLLATTLTISSAQPYFRHCTDLTDSTIRGCTLARTNFSKATGVLFDPQHNRAKGARIALEAALAMARSAGMVVEEFEQ